VGIPRRAVTPDLPDIYNIWLPGIAIDLDKFATSFGANHGDMVLKFGDKLIKLAWLYIYLNE
jgi:hypothetical protein